MTVLIGSNELKSPLLGATTLKQIRAGDKKVFPKGYSPTSNTIAYFPFNEDANDHSGNGVTLSNTQYISKQTLGYKWQFSQGSTGYGINLDFYNSEAKFIGLWYNVLSASGNSNVCVISRYGASGYNPSHGNSNLYNKITTFTSSSWSIGGQSNGMSFNAWHHLAIGYDGSKILVFKDGVQSTLYNGSGYNFNNGIVIVGGGNNTNMQCLFSDFICEKVCWNQAQITEYYNNTKSLYGIS